MKVLILVTMFFCHIVDDYYLQGVLANMKQKSWWEKQTSNKLYKYDYIIALIEHAFSWSFVMMLPILVYMIATNNIGPKAVASYVVMIIYNLWFHSYIDNQKANKLQHKT